MLLQPVARVYNLKMSVLMHEYSPTSLMNPDAIIRSAHTFVHMPLVLLEHRHSLHYKVT